MGAKIITIRHSDSYSFRVFSHQLLRQKQISRDQVFTGLLETIVDRQADVLERFGAELDRLSKNIFRRDEPEGKTSKRVPVSSALRLTLQDLGRVGDLLTRQRDCLVNLLRLLTYASNEEALDDTNSTLYIKLRPQSRGVPALSEYADGLSSNVSFMLGAGLGLLNIGAGTSLPFPNTPTFFPATSTSCWTPFWASSTSNRTKSLKSSPWRPWSSCPPH